MSNQEALVSRTLSKIRSELRFIYGADNDSKYLKDIAISIQESNVIVLTLPDRTDLSGFGKTYLTKIRNKLESEMVGYQTKLLFNNNKSQHGEPFYNLTSKYQKETEQAYQTSNLNIKLTFEDFIEDTSNKYAYKVCQKVAKGSRNGMIILTGDVGLGKTHLLNSIGHKVLSNSSEKNVKLIAASGFTNSFIQSIYDKSSKKNFDDDYNKLDYFLFDDIHFLEGKKQTLKKLFEIIDLIISNNKTVVLTSKKLQNYPDFYEDWMLSRLTSGLIVEIEKPSDLLRRTFLEDKLSSRRLELAADIRSWMVESLPGNLRELGGCIDKLTIYNEIDGSQKLSLDKVKILFHSLVKRKDKKILIEQIKTSVCEDFNISLIEIISKSRSKSLVRPRQIAMYLCKKMTSRSLPEIGRHFGNRDHSTVIHAINVITKKMKEESHFSENITTLERKIIDS